MQKHLWRLAGLLGLFLVGCATPESRIKENPELFAGFPPDVQENVRAGIIKVGYDKNMVYIALGNPDRTSMRETADGAVEVWIFTDTYTTTERKYISGPTRVRMSDGSYKTTDDGSWVDVQQEHEY